MKDDHSCDSHNKAQLAKVRSQPTVRAMATSSSTNSNGTVVPVPDETFIGSWQLYDSQNFDDFLKELGVGYFTRVAAGAASSTYYISKNDQGEWVLKTASTFGDSEIKFKSGVTFKESRLDGNTVDSTITIVGNVWKQVQKSDANVVTIDREFIGDEIITTSTVNGVECVRKYKKVWGFDIAHPLPLVPNHKHSKTCLSIVERREARWIIIILAVLLPLYTTCTNTLLPTSLLVSLANKSSFLPLRKHFNFWFVIFGLLFSNVSIFYAFWLLFYFSNYI